MTNDPIDSRLTDLEINASFAEDMVDELNRLVARQQDQIDWLLREVRSPDSQIVLPRALPGVCGEPLAPVVMLEFVPGYRGGGRAGISPASHVEEEAPPRPRAPAS